MKLTRSFTSSRLTMPLRPVDLEVTHNQPSPMSLRTINISPGTKLVQHQQFPCYNMLSVIVLLRVMDLSLLHNLAKITDIATCVDRT